MKTVHQTFGEKYEIGYKSCHVCLLTFSPSVGSLENEHQANRQGHTSAVFLNIGVAAKIFSSRSLGHHLVNDNIDQIW